METEKRPAAEAADGAAAPKQAKVDLNPLTGTPYSPRFYELLARRQKLPTWTAREDILRLMQSGQVAVLVGETGAGKSTQLPQILLDAGYHMQNGQVKALACVQPQNLAAVSAATRIAEELEVPLGSYVGYHVRFEDKSSPDTLLRMVTGEALLHEALVDQNLSKYSVLLVDEVHARTMVTDVLLALLKGVLTRRPELKLIVMAANMDVQSVQRYFGDAPLLQVPGQSHQVDIHYMLAPERDYLKVAVRTVMQIHSSEPEGDVLVFLSSEEEVEHACSRLRKEALRVGPARSAELGELVAVPLHQGVPYAQQQRAFEAPPAAKAAGGKAGRKVVVATSVAETSVAIDGVAYVVDCGFEHARLYNPRTRMEAKLAVPVSRASASQRAARAGTGKPGKCYRLYAEKAFKTELPEHVHPEILRSNLAGVVLFLKRMGIDNLVHFDFLDPPSPEAMMRAFETLHHLGCVDSDGDVTDLGDQCSKLPVDPQLARMLFESPKHKCSNEALSIAAMLSVKPVFLRPTESAKAADEARARFAHLDGDHLTLLNVFHAYKQHVQDGMHPDKFCAENFLDARALQLSEVVRENLRQNFEQLGLAFVSTDFQDKEYYPNIRRCLVGGFFMQAAHLERAGTYLTMRENQEAAMHPFTTLQNRPEWVLYDEFTLTSRNFLRTVTQIHGEWLVELAPDYYDLEKFPKNNSRAVLEKLRK